MTDRAERLLHIVTVMIIAILVLCIAVAVIVEPLASAAAALTSILLASWLFFAEGLRH